MAPTIRLAIVGGGPVGIVTLKTFLRNSKPNSQIQAMLFEAHDEIGGSFLNAYEGGTLVSSKQITAFSDFRIPHEYPNHISFTDYAEYLAQYCSHFELWPSIKLNAHVQKVEILNGQTWRYRIHYMLSIENDITSATFDCSHIAVCTGLQSQPYQPFIPGIKHFSGKILHSADYKSPSQLKDEHVVIIGCGESAMDIAYAGIKSKAKSVTLCFRRGFLSIPRSLDFQICGKFIGCGVPLDWLNTNLFETAYVHYAINASRLRFRFIDFVTNVVLNYLTGDDGEAGQEVGVLSTQAWRKIYVNRRQEEIMSYINGPYKKRRVPGSIITNTDRWIDTCTIPSHICPTGLIHFTPDLSRKDYKRVVKGPPVYATTIIFCTGYRTRSSFLPPSCPDVSNAICRHLVAPEDPTIAYLGFLRSWVGSSGPLGEMQAMWWLAHLQGAMSRLPTSPDNYTLLTKDGRGVDFGLYMAQLAQDIGAKPSLSALLWIYGPKVVLSYCFGSSFVSFYRLVGPFKEPNAMKAIAEGELIQTIKRKGLVGNFLFGILPMMIFGVLNGVAWLLEWLRLL